jgi:serine phosphatase RsbU (regulator of sigma subunit)/pSer/pThr/pTyr-binding forkhead associated (FHA) protein
MASLRIEKGLNPGQVIPIAQEKTTLGRNPDCHVVIPITSVSREHAHIIRAQGKFFIEDLQSRNGTFVNDKQIAGRTQLRSNDRIRICDFQAIFQDPVEGVEAEDDHGDELIEGTTTVEARLTSNSNILLDTQPAEKLTALLEISSNLSKTLKLDTLLPKIGDSLFQLFRQADRCFIILAEEATGRLMPKLIKTRRPQDESTARFSRTIIRQCLETAQSVLLDDAGSQMPTSQSVVDFRIRSVMCTPLRTAQGKAFGVIQLDTQDRSKKFTEEDLRLLWGVANQASIAMENAQLHESLVAQERVQRDLELAKAVQLSFLPPQLPEVAGYEFFAHYEAALEVGGDYYGFIPLTESRLAIALGDVAGKGIPAALLMAKLSSDARFALLTEPEAKAGITKLNNLLHQHISQMDRFVTLAAVVLDPANHRLTLVNAGHPSPLLYNPKAAALEDCVPRAVAGVPLGMMEDYDYESCQIQLRPGDCILIFSDGVPDARSVRDTAFEMKGIHQALAAGGPFTAKTLGERIVKAVRQHATGRSPHDDITLVCLGRVL